MKVPFGLSGRWDVRGSREPGNCEATTVPLPRGTLNKPFALCRGFCIFKTLMGPFKKKMTVCSHTHRFSSDISRESKIFYYLEIPYREGSLEGLSWLQNPHLPRELIIFLKCNLHCWSKTFQLCSQSLNLQ